MLILSTLNLMYKIWTIYVSSLQINTISKTIQYNFVYLVTVFTKTTSYVHQCLNDSSFQLIKATKNTEYRYVDLQRQINRTSNT